jgi:hypothetical protein
MAKHPASDRREAVCAWLTANGINPRNVPADADMTVEDGPDGRVLRCEVFDLTQDGHVQTDERGEKAAILVATVPLKVEPPEWWQPHVKPTRDQLLAAVDRVRAVHVNHEGNCYECTRGYDVMWPCHTIEALNGTWPPKY